VVWQTSQTRVEVVWAVESSPIRPTVPGAPDFTLKSTTLPGNEPLGAVISSLIRKMFFVLCAVWQVVHPNSPYCPPATPQPLGHFFGVHVPPPATHVVRDVRPETEQVPLNSELWVFMASGSVGAFLSVL
jgi:hypothetical protein